MSILNAPAKTVTNGTIAFKAISISGSMSIANGMITSIAPITANANSLNSGPLAVNASDIGPLNVSAISASMKINGCPIFSIPSCIAENNKKNCSLAEPPSSADR